MSLRERVGFRTVLRRRRRRALHIASPTRGGARVARQHAIDQAIASIDRPALIQQGAQVPPRPSRVDDGGGARGGNSGCRCPRTPFEVATGQYARSACIPRTGRRSVVSGNEGGAGCQSSSQAELPRPGSGSSPHCRSPGAGPPGMGPSAVRGTGGDATRGGFLAPGPETGLPLFSDRLARPLPPRTLPSSGTLSAPRSRLAVTSRRGYLLGKGSRQSGACNARAPGLWRRFSVLASTLRCEARCAAAPYVCRSHWWSCSGRVPPPALAAAPGRRPEDFPFRPGSCSG